MTAQAATERTPLRCAIQALGESVHYAMHHVERGGEEDAAAREWLFEMCSWVQRELLDPADRAEMAEALKARVGAEAQS